GGGQDVVPEQRRVEDQLALEVGLDHDDLGDELPVLLGELVPFVVAGHPEGLELAAEPDALRRGGRPGDGHRGSFTHGSFTHGYSTCPSSDSRITAAQG